MVVVGGGGGGGGGGGSSGGGSAAAAVVNGTKMFTRVSVHVTFTSRNVMRSMSPSNFPPMGLAAATFGTLQATRKQQYQQVTKATVSASHLIQFSPV